MDTKSNSAASPSYQDFQPTSKLLRDEASDTLALNIPGFRKEHLKIQMDGYGNLKISGERPVDALGKKFSRFLKELRVSRNCNIHEVHAKLENGILSIIMPKKTTQATAREQPTTTPSQESPESSKTEQVPESDTRRKKVSGSTTEEQMNRNGDKSAEATHEKVAENEREKKSEPSKNEQKMESIEAKRKKGAETEGEKKSEESKNEQKMEYIDATGKGSSKNATSLRDYKHWMGGLVLGMKKNRRLIVNVLVATMLMVVLGIYVICHVRYPTKTVN